MAFRGCVFPNEQSTLNTLKANPVIIDERTKNANIYDMYQI